jgi:hypothetical protein
MSKQIKKKFITCKKILIYKKKWVLCKVLEKKTILEQQSCQNIWNQTLKSRLFKIKFY